MDEAPRQPLYGECPHWNCEFLTRPGIYRQWASMDQLDAGLPTALPYDCVDVSVLDTHSAEWTEVQ